LADFFYGSTNLQTQHATLVT